MDGFLIQAKLHAMVAEGCKEGNKKYTVASYRRIARDK
jgi:hypothetical protein